VGPAVLTRLRAVLAWRDVRLLAGIFLAIQVLDALTTWLALRTPRFTEGNPWLDQAVATHPLLTYAAKLAIALAVVTSLLLIRMRWRLRDCVLGLFAVISLVAPASNALRLAGWLS
jgi:hypothetical protein